MGLVCGKLVKKSGKPCPNQVWFCSNGSGTPNPIYKVPVSSSCSFAKTMPVRRYYIWIKTPGVWATSPRPVYVPPQPIWITVTGCGEEDEMDPRVSMFDPAELEGKDIEDIIEDYVRNVKAEKDYQINICWERVVEDGKVVHEEITAGQFVGKIEEEE